MPGFVSRIRTFGGVAAGLGPGSIASLSASPVFARLQGRHGLSMLPLGAGRDGPGRAGRSLRKADEFETKKSRKETEKCLAVQCGIVCGSGRSGFPEHAWRCASQGLQAPPIGVVGPTPSLVLLYLTEASPASSGRLTQR